MATGGTHDHASFDERVATPGDQRLPEQPGWAQDPSVALQAAALRAQPTAEPSRPPVTKPNAAADRAHGR
jgi:hypothetical protein